MKCNKAKIGTYDCVYCIMPPFETGCFEKKFKFVSIDKCLLREILDLWEQGIKTTGCCCGHGTTEAYIGVEFEDIDKMKALGYKIQYNPSRPNDEDSFYPKTLVDYGNN